MAQAQTIKLVHFYEAKI